MADWNTRAIEIFGEAVTIDEQLAREKFVDEACGDDGELKQLVYSFLESNLHAEDFLERPVAQFDMERARVVTAVGTTIDKYKVLEELGEGGFGIVYMAEQKEPLRRRVALKIIKPGMDTNEVIARFESERQALALMKHQNIAAVIDAGTTDNDRPYFVMELIKGVPITQFCDENDYSIDRRFELFVQVCAAVQHAHQKGIVHRDIKPSNVMVTADGGEPVVKVIDFGVAKAIDQELTEKTLFTSYGKMVGTPQYMSPEQAQLNARDVDTRSDIYSLGVLLYELLTGTTPFCPRRLKESGFDEIRRIIGEEDPPLPSQRVSSLSDMASTSGSSRTGDSNGRRELFAGEVDWIVMKAMAKDRDLRYPTAVSLAEEVGRFLRDLPIEARPPSTWYQLRKLVRRKKSLFVAVSAVAVSLLLGIIGTSLALLQSQRESARAAAANELLREEVANRAHADAMGGYGENLEATLELLRHAGESESEIELIRGKQTHYSGRNFVEARRHFERAIELDPTNYNAKFELVHALVNSGDVRGIQVMAEEVVDAMKKTRPRSARDFASLGLAQATYQQPDLAMKTFQAGLNVRDTPQLAMHLASARATKAAAKGDLESLYSARDELWEVAGRVGGGNKHLQHQQVFVTRLIYLEEKKNDIESDIAMLEHADECADALCKQVIPPFPLMNIAWYWEHVRGDDPESLKKARAAWEKACDRSIGDLYHTLYASYLLRHDGIDAALERMSIPEDQSPFSGAFHGILLAMQRDGWDEAGEIWQELAHDKNELHCVLVGMLLGDEDGLQELVSRWDVPEESGRSPFLQFVVGKLGQNDFLERCQNSDIARFYVALKLLRDRRREEAITYFESLGETHLRLPSSYEVVFAPGILAETRKASDWPNLKP